MALIIKDKQVVYVAPPVRLTKDEKQILENAPVFKINHHMNHLALLFHLSCPS